MQGTQFRPSWNRPSTHLIMCLSRLTLRLAFRTRSGSVCQFALPFVSFKKVCVDPPAGYAVQPCSAHIPRWHLDWSIRVSIVESRHRGHQRLQRFRRHGSEYVSGSKLFIFVLGLLGLPTDRPRTVHVTFHLVHPPKRERIAAVVAAPLFIDNF